MNFGLAPLKAHPYWNLRRVPVSDWFHFRVKDDLRGPLLKGVSVSRRRLVRPLAPSQMSSTTQRRPPPLLLCQGGLAPLEAHYYWNLRPLAPSQMSSTTQRRPPPLLLCQGGLAPLEAHYYWNLRRVPVSDWFHFRAKDDLRGPLLKGVSVSRRKLVRPLAPSRVFAPTQRRPLPPHKSSMLGRQGSAPIL